MQFGRAVLSSVIALSLVACGGGDSSGSGTPPPTSGGDGGGGGECSLANRQQFVRDVLDEWYLFPDLIDTSVNPASFTNVQDYIDALVAPARAQNKDRFFSYITSIEEETDLIENGSNAGFGFRVVYDTAANRVFIAEAFEAGNGFAAGIDRGSELLAIGNQSVADLMASGGPNAVIDAFGPSDPGVTRTIRFRTVEGVERTEAITKSEFSLDPISDRYGVEIFDNGGTQVGYVNLRTFIVQDASQQLREAFADFKAAGVDQIILDLRYNGGGLVSVAELLGDLLAADQVGNVFSNTVLRPSKSSENSTEEFLAQPQAIDATKIAVIGRGGTASASELVTNSMIPYVGENLALIGANTFGKPVGQFAFDRSACDDRFRAVTFKTTNANDQGEYFDGLASVVPNTCRADDGIFTPLGDPSEASISVALDFLAGRSCTAITRAETRGVQGVERSFQLIQPDRPSAVQREVPGIF